MTGRLRMGIAENLTEWDYRSKFAAVAVSERALQEAKKTGWAKCPARPNWHNSENELQRKLNQTWVGIAVVRRNLAEAVIPRARISTVEAGSRDTKLRVIEQIEEFGSELNAEPFGDGRPLENGEIKVVDYGSAQ